MQLAKQVRFSRKRRLSSSLCDALAARTPHRSTAGRTRALRRIDGMFSMAAKACARRCWIGHVVVQQRQIELDVQRFLEQLPRQVHARFGRVDVPVQADDQIVRHDGIAGGEERHQPLDQVPVGRRHPLRQVAEVDLEVDLLHRPGVLDRRRDTSRRSADSASAAASDRSRDRAETLAVHGRHGAHWQASQDSGFSSEHTTAAVSLTCGCVACTVVLAMCVAGRERR